MPYTATLNCFENGILKYQGKVGSDLTTEQGRDAAKSTTLIPLSMVKQAIGDLDRLHQVEEPVGFVASAPGFGRQPEVLDGASELLGHILGG